MTPRLETERLILREIHAEDMEEIFYCWMQNENVSRYMWWKASDDINEAKEFVEFELDNLDKDSWNRWIMVLKETKEIIGTCLIFLMRKKNIGIYPIILENLFGKKGMSQKR